MKTFSTCVLTIFRYSMRFLPLPSSPCIQTAHTDMFHYIDSSKTTRSIEQNTSASSSWIGPVGEIIVDKLWMGQCFQHERRTHIYRKIFEEVKQDGSAARLPIIPTSLLTGYVQLEMIRPEKLSIVTWVTTNTISRAYIERWIDKNTKCSRVDSVMSY